MGINQQPMIEPALVMDIFASAIGKVEVLGHNVRITFCVMQDRQWIVVAKVVLPIEACPLEVLSPLTDVHSVAALQNH